MFPCFHWRNLQICNCEQHRGVLMPGERIKYENVILILLSRTFTLCRTVWAAAPPSDGSLTRLSAGCVVMRSCLRWYRSPSRVTADRLGHVVEKHKGTKCVSDSLMERLWTGLRCLALGEAEPYPGRELCRGRYSVLFDLRRGKPPSALVWAEKEVTGSVLFG